MKDEKIKFESDMARMIELEQLNQNYDWDPHCKKNAPPISLLWAANSSYISTLNFSPPFWACFKCTAKLANSDISSRVFLPRPNSLDLK